MAKAKLVTRKSQRNAEAFFRVNNLSQDVVTCWRNVTLYDITSVCFKELRALAPVF